MADNWSKDIPVSDGEISEWVRADEDGTIITERERVAINRAEVAADRAENAYNGTTAYFVQFSAWREEISDWHDDVSASRNIVLASQADVTAKQTLVSQDRNATAQDRAATAADRVQTGLDRTQTGADRTNTGLDRDKTTADRAVTTADRAATAADRIQTGQDRAATLALRNDTETLRDSASGHRATAQAAATAANQDAAATAADRVQTGQDRTATAADRVQTGQDRTNVANNRDYVQARVDELGSFDPAAVNAHLTAYNNPHQTTAAQVGAVALVGDTMTGQLILSASTTDRSSLRVPHGAAPSAPVNGDIWTASTGLMVRVNGATRTMRDDANMAAISQAEAEAGTATTLRAFTAQRIAQAIAALATPAKIGLGNVNNTSDANKPVSTAQQAALDTKENKGTVAQSAVVGPGQTGGVALYFGSTDGRRFYADGSGNGALGALKIDGNWAWYSQNDGNFWIANALTVNGKLNAPGNLDITNASPVIDHTRSGVANYKTHIFSDGMWAVCAGDYTRRLGIATDGQIYAYSNLRGQSLISATYFLSQQNYPQYQLLYPGVRQWSMQVRENTYWYLWDDSAGTARMFVDTAGNLWTSAYGYVHDRIENRAAAWANDRVAALATRLVSRGGVGSSGTFDVEAPSGAVLTGATKPSAGNITNLYYRYLQLYDPVRGWVGAAYA